MHKDASTTGEVTCNGPRRLAKQGNSPLIHMRRSGLPRGRRQVWGVSGLWALSLCSSSLERRREQDLHGGLVLFFRISGTGVQLERNGCPRFSGIRKIFK